MGLGQTMLVLGAMALLGVVVLTSQTSVLETNEAQNESDAGITAVSLASSLVEEISGKMFDEAIADSGSGTVSSPSSFTSPARLGKDGSESYHGGANDFDDCDDYNQMSLFYRDPSDAGNIPSGVTEVLVRGLRARYLVRTTVCYVDDSNLDIAATTQKWSKKITVVVKSPGNPALPDSVSYSTILSFWN
jgi:hypothetical protein